MQSNGFDGKAGRQMSGYQRMAKGKEAVAPTEQVPRSHTYVNYAERIVQPVLCSQTVRLRRWCRSRCATVTHGLRWESMRT
jgi:hypothetical protein